MKRQKVNKVSAIFAVLLAGLILIPAAHAKTGTIHVRIGNVTASYYAAKITNGAFANNPPGAGCFAVRSRVQFKTAAGNNGWTLWTESVSAASSYAPSNTSYFGGQTGCTVKILGYEVSKNQTL